MLLQVRMLVKAFATPLEILRKFIGVHWFERKDEL
jgi:hypothetical protein